MIEYGLKISTIILVIVAIMGCTTTAKDGKIKPARITQNQEQFAQDRKAILAMTGDYAVSFHFEELVALQQGYQLKPVKNSGGKETVFVVEDTGNVIRLQHILVVGPKGDPIVVKHWRQDWIYEPRHILEYAGNEIWRTRQTLFAEYEGAWAQTVYQVDDSPRYAALASWHHEGGVSTWESPATWRPLPRRDAITRDDYQVMQAVNRHTITPWGWAHEQDNEKLVLSNNKVIPLVREVGVNSYRSIDSFPESIVTDYWDKTEGFWSYVRTRWNTLEANANTIHVEGKEPDDSIYEPILDIVSNLENGEITDDIAFEQFDSIIATRVAIEGN